MNELPMPSDVAASAPAAETSVGEPPSAKLIVRLFIIPLFIVAAAVGVMFLIGVMAGGTPSIDDAIARLKRPGGARTADFLVGPGAKQRYIDAKTLVDQMKAGMSEPQRIKLSNELIDVLEHYTHTDEGQVQEFLLLALGRVWQRGPSDTAPDSPDAAAARQATLATLLKYANSDQLPARKAALLAMVYWSGRDEVKQILPILISKIRDDREDLDVRMAATTALGPLATPTDTDAIAALNLALRDTEPQDRELVWDAALSLAELNRPEATDTILKLLDRSQLSTLEYYDRETDPQNPSYRKLSEQEQQRFLINAMLGAAKLQVPAVQDQLKKIAAGDPSARVKAAAMEILQGSGVSAGDS